MQFTAAENSYTQDVCRLHIKHGICFTARFKTVEGDNKKTQSQSRQIPTNKPPTTIRRTANQTCYKNMSHVNCRQTAVLKCAASANSFARILAVRSHKIRTCEQRFAENVGYNGCRRHWKNDLKFAKTRNVVNVVDYKTEYCETLMICSTHFVICFYLPFWSVSM